MMKLTNFVLAAMIASPFVIRYLRYRRLSAFVRMVPQLEEIQSDGKKSEKPREHFIRIPAFAVAAVIGKRKQALQKLMNDSQTECVIRTYTPEELDVAENEMIPDAEWVKKFESDDWFSDENANFDRKITYLVVFTSDEKKLQFIRLRIAEIIEIVQKPWKTAEFLVDTHLVGYLVGRGGRNIKGLRDKFNVQIQISDPNPENPEKSTVSVKGRDYQSLKEVEYVMKETVLPRNYNKIPRYDEDTLIESGIYESVEKELDDLKRASQLLAQGFTL